MRAMVLDAPGRPLRLAEWPRPKPGAGQVLVRVRCCGVCRTDLHVVDGDLTAPALPVVPGHEIVGTVAAVGVGVDTFAVGYRVGIPWSADRAGPAPTVSRGARTSAAARATPAIRSNGGYAEYTVADARYCFRLLPSDTPTSTAPAALRRADRVPGLRLASAAVEGAERLGLYGFGAAAHIVMQVAAMGREVYVVDAPGRCPAQALARELGAVWAGGPVGTARGGARRRDRVRPGRRARSGRARARWRAAAWSSARAST